MPHVVVKLWPGRSEEQKTRLAEAIVKDLKSIMNSGEDSVSVAVEEVKREDWVQQVYEPDIRGRWSQLYKKPGYKPSDI